MNVLLIQAPLRPGDNPVYPIGLAYLASAVAARGHRVQVYDPNLRPGGLREDLARFLPSGGFDLVGVSLRNIDNTMLNDPYLYYAALRPLLEEIRRLLPSARRVVGGAGYSIFPELIVRRQDAIDIGIPHNGTQALIELLDHLDAPETVKGLYIRRGVDVLYTGPRDIRDLHVFPPLQWDLIDVRPYAAFPYSVGVVSKSGCVFRCTYCTYPQLSGRQMIARPPAAIVDDMEYLQRRAGLRQCFLVDSIFNYPPDHAAAVCEEILRRGLAMEWSSYFLEKYFTRDLMTLAVRAGCTLFQFSPDGTHDPSMQALGKESTEADLARTYELIRDGPGARAAFTFFFNPPGQTLRGFLRYLALYARTRLWHPDKFTACSAWYPRIYPDTPLHRYAVEQGPFPATADELLPETPEELPRVFWVNRDNAWLNTFYRHVVVRRTAWRRARR